MKKVGIWIDKREAKIVTIDNGKENLSIVPSEIDEFNPKGGSGTRFKGGPQDVVQDSKYLNREKQQFKGFFEKVIEGIQEADVIFILGPAETGEKLYSELKDNYHDLYSKTNPVEKADVMTDNQLKARIRDHFQSA